MGDTILKMLSISKYFGSSAANEDVKLEVKKGEIHSLLGENGTEVKTDSVIMETLIRPMPDCE